MHSALIIQLFLSNQYFIILVVFRNIGHKEVIEFQQINVLSLCGLSSYRSLIVVTQWIYKANHRRGKLTIDHYTLYPISTKWKAELFNQRGKLTHKPATLAHQGRLIEHVKSRVLTPSSQLTLKAASPIHGA